MSHTTTVLCILDGWGISPETEHNPIRTTSTPTWDMLCTTGQYTELNASGEAVGLPEGQMGNSEVGHLTIGSGRVIDHDLVRINKAVSANTLKDQIGFQEFATTMEKHGGSVHIMGLFSPGGVHCHTDHIIHSIRCFQEKGIPVHLHLFCDGRDTPPSSAYNYLNQALVTHGELLKNVSISSISGRFYAMDRDNRWDRTEAAYNAIVRAKAQHQYTDPCDYIYHSYKYHNTTDEFIIPAVSDTYQGIMPHDGVFMVNFRADRMRQLVSAIADPDFNLFPRQSHPITTVAGMTSYSEKITTYMAPIFPPLVITNSLGEVCANAHMSQLRLAETEKYAHVTYFFNGGNEIPFVGEVRTLIPSPNVRTYDMKPEMSAFEITTELTKAITSHAYDLIVVNYANPDMVGHTGNEAATREAIACVDKCLNQIHNAFHTAQRHNLRGNFFITADHGNAEKMVDATTHQAHTAHTLSPVPFVYMAYGKKTPVASLTSGCLADIAPTLLEAMAIEKPHEMTGKSLFIHG
ncbi:MAG: 2,3-bisphosphoglycerate-independent phosphoglycerate mutase [Alphaproteobacteria bacterium]|nr:MAG: 2,3-bisphosphoglycerate-independent phosphoglycerate mutase [Alphaproteobacteria bacterium]